jgi:hypothetical protein
MRSKKCPSLNKKWFCKVVDRHCDFMPIVNVEFNEFEHTHKCAFNSLNDLEVNVTKRDLKFFTSKKYGFRLFKLEVEGLQKQQTIFKECDVITKVDITNQYLA